MKKTIKCVVTCLALVMPSLQLSLVQGQAPVSEGGIDDQFPVSIEERPYFESPEYYFENDMPEGWHQPHFKNSEKREFIPPTEENLRLTQKQVQAFDCGTVTDVPRLECEAWSRFMRAPMALAGPTIPTGFKHDGRQLERDYW